MIARPNAPSGHESKLRVFSSRHGASAPVNVLQFGSCLRPTKAVHRQALVTLKLLDRKLKCLVLGSIQGPSVVAQVVEPGLLPANFLDRIEMPDLNRDPQLKRILEYQ